MGYGPVRKACTKPGADDIHCLLRSALLAHVCTPTWGLDSFWPVRRAPSANG